MVWFCLNPVPCAHRASQIPCLAFITVWCLSLKSNEVPASCLSARRGRACAGLKNVGKVCCCWYAFPVFLIFMLFHNLLLESKVKFLYQAHHSFMGGVALGVTHGWSQTWIPNCLTSIICFSFSSFFSCSIFAATARRASAPCAPYCRRICAFVPHVTC